MLLINLNLFNLQLYKTKIIKTKSLQMSSVVCFYLLKKEKRVVDSKSILPLPDYSIEYLQLGLHFW